MQTLKIDPDFAGLFGGGSCVTPENFPTPIAPGSRRLWSLWDMIRFYANHLLSVSRELALVDAYAGLSTGFSTVKLSWNNPELIEKIRAVKKHVSELGLVASTHAAQGLLDLLENAEQITASKERNASWLRKKLFPNSFGHNVIKAHDLSQRSAILSASIRAELSESYLLAVPLARKDLYSQSEPLFGQVVHDQFSKARYEIAEAGKSLALGRSTACVFHLMRAMEVALRAVNSCLSLPDPGNRSWGVYLNGIRQERQRRGGASKWAENDLFQDIWQRLDSVKDAQRDPTMHVESVYTEEEAAAILESTKSFMKKVAARMDQDGNPKA